MRLLLTGASGQLGAYVLKELAHKEWTVAAWSGSRTGRIFGRELQPVDLRDGKRAARVFHQFHPTAIIHAAALTSVTACRAEPLLAEEVNVEGTRVLAELATREGVRILYVSTDLVFDGERAPYREQDSPCPLSIYGQTKVLAERVILAAPRSMVVRPSLLFGPTLLGRPYFFDEQIAALREQRRMTLFKDEWRTPLSMATAARALILLLQSEFEGILHLGGPERLSRLEMGQRLARFLNVDAGAIQAGERGSVPASEPRPRDASLDSSLWRSLLPGEPWPGWEDALTEMGVL
jgi:dTDP-4-dehydrorhamnose reductase